MRAVLLIADIGGYTKFMRVHRINLAHAQYVVAQLLEAVIDAASPKLSLAKLEGDAAFFYAKLPDAMSERELVALGQQVHDIRRAFLQRRVELDTNRLCSCDGCVQAAQLDLKFVAHLGEVALQKVKRYTELAGVDVITVHRLLKNSVPIREYVLMSEPVFAGLAEEHREGALQLTEHLEGLGELSTRYIDLTKAPVPAAGEGSKLAALLAWVKMTWRALPFMLGLRSPCEGFKNLDAIGSVPPGTPVSEPTSSGR